MGTRTVSPTVPGAGAPPFALYTIKKRGDDPALVKALTWRRITGLDFDPDNQVHATASMKKFDTWFRGVTDAFTAAVKIQTAIVFDKAATPQARLEATARYVMLQDQVASLLRNVEIPSNIRTNPEAVTAFCDAMDEKVVPIEASAKQGREACAKVIADGKLAAGWWSEFCVVPAAP